MAWLDYTISSNEIEDRYVKDISNRDVRVSDSSTSNGFFEYDENISGVDIDGYLFFPESVDGTESFSHREFLRTKIFSGGEFVTRGQYIPKEFSFNTVIDIEPEHLDEYLNIFSEMENKVCRITSPYMGGMFKGEVNISVTNPETSPHVIECKVTIKEIPDVMARLKGDPVIQYPSINTVSDVKVTQRGNHQVEDKNKLEHEDIYDAYNSSQSSNF